MSWIVENILLVGAVAIGFLLFLVTNSLPYDPEIAARAQSAAGLGI